VGRCGLLCSCSGWESEVGSREHDSETSGSIKGGEFVD
jgi:hypothetical protein